MCAGSLLFAEHCIVKCCVHYIVCCLVVFVAHCVFACCAPFVAAFLLWLGLVVHILRLVLGQCGACQVSLSWPGNSPNKPTIVAAVP
jgi:hypothetical protein